VIVELIASTQVHPDAFPEMPRDPNSTDAEHLITGAGRQCYTSFHRPNAATRADADYIRRTVLEQGHESVIEHASASFHVSGVSRNLLLELERHRFLSFSVISQRYVDASTPGHFVLPPALDVDDPNTQLLADEMLQSKQTAMDVYETTVVLLIAQGRTRKQAREAARAILPGNMSTTFIVTGNLRAWRDVLKRRYSTHADAEIAALATEILSHLRRLAPSVFADFPEEMPS
jgi:thymidylate synthase (FAD)